MSFQHRNRSLKPRSLRCETLENRDLMAVSIVSLTNFDDEVVDAQPIFIEFSEPIQLASATQSDFSLTANGVAVELPQRLGLVKVGPQLYKIGGSDLGNIINQRGNFTFTFSGEVNDLSGNPSTVFASESWRRNQQPDLLFDKVNAAKYTEGRPAVALVPGVTVVDPESPNFKGGFFTATITNNFQVDDQLFFRDQGTGPKQIGVSDTTVSYEGVDIGTYSGGESGTPLRVDFNDKANAVSAQALLRNLMFQNPSDNVTTLRRTVTFQIFDGGLKKANVPFVNFNRLVDTIPVNDEPLLTVSGSTNYTLNAPPVKLAPIAQIFDNDSQVYNGGKLTINVAQGATSADRITFTGGAFSLSGNNVIYLGGAIGTINTGGGRGTTPLEITFNRSGFRTIVEKLIREVRFSTVGGTSVAQRKIQFLLIEKDGIQSNTAEVLVNVNS